MVHSNLERTIDGALVLRPSSASPIATQTTTIETQVVDIGSGLVKFDIYVDVGTFDVAGSDDIAYIELYGSAAVAMTSPELLGVLVIGNATAINGVLGTTTSNRGVGEYILPCHNIAKVSGVDTPMRYLRMSTTTAGASVSLDFTAWMAKRT